MNVNGSRFELLLGRQDWGRCREGGGDGARTLDAAWTGALASPPVDPGPELPAWDVGRSEVILRPRLVELPDTEAEQPLSLAARRAAGADRHGNVYRIGDDRSTLVVYSAGSRRESVFWPVPAGCEEAPDRFRRDFQPAAPAQADEGGVFLALAVTEDHYLVVAHARGATRGFLAFDLVAGGPPVATAWPASPGFDPFDMAPRPGGGVWVLDRARRRLWEFDCRLAVVSVAQAAQTLAPGERDDFQPVSGEVRERAPVVFPAGIDLAAAGLVQPIAVEAPGEGRVLLLDIDEPAGRSRVVRLRREGGAWIAHASRWLDELPRLAHDFVLGRVRLFQGAEASPLLFIVTRAGNQARAYTVVDGTDAFDLTASVDLFPLRRFGGRALVDIREGGHYDSGIATVVWTPIVQQPRALYESRARFVTPVFDSFDVGTTWDRVVLDACLPPDTAVAIESRAGDEFEGVLAQSPPGSPDALEASPPTLVATQVIGAWMPEPPPILRGTGPELPHLRGEAARATRRENGVGSWDTLLQNARGRYLQLRITLTSANGMVTPRLRALRAWSPRFSYPKRFLPAVYREDATAGPFLERWLANLEGTLTQIEERVVNVQALFDPRIAPAETLAWLASWLDVAFDPAWDVRRQRLFLKRALDYFRWRGTVRGLRLALELAFDRCIPEAAFDDPVPGENDARRIRIVETYQTRLVGGLAAGDPGGAEPGPRIVKREAMWSPAEGNGGLVERHAAFMGKKTASASEQVTPFPLLPPDGGDARKWAAFAEAALGFVPSAGAAERARWASFVAARGVKPQGIALPRDYPAPPEERARWDEFVRTRDGAWMRARWHDFLARRYRSIGKLNRAWQTAWPGFDRVALPDALPGTVAAQADWLQFERRLLAMHRTAHRFSVLLPLDSVAPDPSELEHRLGLARRIVELEKPAHTIFDVRFYWAFFRVGEARLGLDTQMGAGSRARELAPEAILGRAYIGASFVGGAPRPTAGDRYLAAC